VLEGSDELNRSLDEYLRVAVRRSWWMLLPACGVALVTMAVSFLLPNVYRSEAVILVEHQKVPEHYVVPNISSDLRNRLGSMTQQIISRSRLLQIIDQFGLYAKERKRLVTEDLVELMRTNIEIKLPDEDPRRTDVNGFRISFSADDPRIAQQVASQLTSLFIEENLKQREQQSVGTTSFLQAQLESAQRELQKQEDQLRELKMRYLGELPEQQTGNLAILTGLHTQLETTMAGLNRARQQRIYLESLLSQFQSLVEAGGTVGGAPGGSPAEVAQREVARLRNERAALLALYTPKHPDILKVEQMIAQAEALQAQLERGEKPALTGGVPTDTAIAQIRSQLEANQAEIDNLLQNEKRLKDQVAEYQRRLNLTPVREQQLANVVRDYNLSKRNYEELLKKKMESELATSLEKRQQGEQFRIIDPPSLPLKPYSPNRPRINLIGASLGLCLAVGLAFIVELRDRSLHTEQDLVRLGSQPLMMGIPELLTSAEQAQRRRRRWLRWSVGILLVVVVIAGEIYFHWRG